MNQLDITVCNFFFRQLFSIFSMAQKKSQKKYNYPVKMFYDNKKVTLTMQSKTSDGAPHETVLTMDTVDEKEKANASKILKVMQDLCERCDKSDWISMQLLSEKKFTCKSEKANYRYSN